MKRIALLLIILAAASCSAAYDLSSAWTLQQEGSSKTYSVKVPCTVAGALNEAGAFGPGVLEQRRYESIDRSMFEVPWTFSTRFSAPKGMHHVLRFNGLGYSADISVNGTLIASSDTTAGMFIVREFDITDIAKPVNVLTVKVHRAPAASLNTGYVDWNPRPVDESMGILRDVELISTPDVQIQDVFVKPILDPANLSKADIVVSGTLINRSAAPVSGCFSGTCEAGSFCEPVTLAPGERKTVSVLQHISKPRIWWTREMGTPELYKLTASFTVGGQLSHRKTVRFGIRSIESEIDSEGHLLFKLNGRPLLIKSAGWTDDIFQQDTHESIRKQVEFVADMGLNCIRFENIWGKDDAVYESCDSLGVLAMVGFSCQWEWFEYCGFPQVGNYGCIVGPENEALALRYFRDQVTRLRNHPSVCGWLTGSDCVPTPELEKRYLEIYRELDYRPYICSAKDITSTVSGPSGTKMAGPYEYVGPDYWFLDKNNGGAFGFNTETGVGMNIPQFESVRKIVGSDHLWPLDSNWNFHCTSSSTDMNTTRVALQAVTGLYGAPSGAGDFVRKAHALDYDATRSMYEAFRCNVPHTTGIVQWMLNSAWPSLYWQLYDWYLVPTAGYFGTKKACAPLQLVFNYADHAVWAVNDAAPQTSLTAVMKIVGPDSRELRSEEKNITLAAREPQAVFGNIEGPCFLSLRLVGADGKTVADNFYCIPAKNNVYQWDKSEWYYTPIAEYSDMSFVSALPAAKLSMSSAPVDGGYSVTVTNESPVVAYQNILKAKDDSGELIPGVIWSDNFFSLLPGESRTVSCKVPSGSAAVGITLSGWNGEVR